MRSIEAYSWIYSLNDCLSFSWKSFARQPLMLQKKMTTNWCSSHVSLKSTPAIGAGLRRHPSWRKGLRSSLMWRCLSPFGNSGEDNDVCRQHEINIGVIQYWFVCVCLRCCLRMSTSMLHPPSSPWARDTYLINARQYTTFDQKMLSPYACLRIYLGK